MSKFYRISEQSLKQLIRDSVELSCLNAFGVDNWHGHGEALSEIGDINNTIQEELDKFNEL